MSDVVDTAQAPQPVQGPSRVDPLPQDLHCLQARAEPVGDAPRIGAYPANCWPRPACKPVTNACSAAWRALPATTPPPSPNAWAPPSITPYSTARHCSPARRCSSRSAWHSASNASSSGPAPRPGRRRVRRPLRQYPPGLDRRLPAGRAAVPGPCRRHRRLPGPPEESFHAVDAWSTMPSPAPRPIRCSVCR